MPSATSISTERHALKARQGRAYIPASRVLQITRESHSIPEAGSKWSTHISSTAFLRVSSDTSQYSAVVPICRWPISF